jgi:hypothetical protein
LVSPLTKTVNILFCCEIYLLIYYVSNTIYLKLLLLQSPLTKKQHHFIFDLWRYLWFNFFNDLRPLCSHLKQEATTQWKNSIGIISARQVSVWSCHGTIDQLGSITAVFSTSNSNLKDLMVLW